MYQIRVFFRHLTFKYWMPFTLLSWLFENMTQIQRTGLLPYVENDTWRQCYLWKTVCFSAPHWQCNNQSVTNKELSPLRSSTSNICTTKVTKTVNKITVFWNIHQSAIGHPVSRSVSHQTYAIDWVSDQIHDRGHRATLQELRIWYLTINKCATIIYYEHSWLFCLYSSCSDMSNPRLPA